MTGALDLDDCELEDVEDYDDDVIAELSCDPAEGADDLALTVFDDDGDLDDAYDEAQAPAGEELDTSGDCATDIYAAHSWTTADEPDGVAGSVACYRDGNGGSAIAWTENEQLPARRRHPKRRVRRRALRAGGPISWTGPSRRRWTSSRMPVRPSC